MPAPHNNAPRFYTLLRLLQPTALGVVVYTVLSLSVIVAQNLSSIKQYFKVSTSARFNPFSDAYDWLVRLLGSNRSSELAEIIFWSLIGLVIYTFVVAGLHTLREFKYDLEEIKYVHPERSDPALTIKNFLKRAVFHVVAALLVIYYCIFLAGAVFGGWLQAWIARNHWLGLYQSVTLLVLFVCECIALHVATILLRLLFLRHRLFG